MNTLQEFEKEAERALQALGKQLPLEAILEAVQDAHFEKDGDDYYSTQIGVGGALPQTYSISLQEGNVLSLWRGRPQDGGVLIRDYRDARVTAFIAEIKRGIEQRGETFVGFQEVRAGYDKEDDANALQRLREAYTRTS